MLHSNTAAVCCAIEVAFSHLLQLINMMNNVCKTSGDPAV